MRAIRLAIASSRLGALGTGSGCPGLIRPRLNASRLGPRARDVPQLEPSLAPAVYASSVEFVDLELRKAGLRLVQDASELDMTRDGGITVQVNKISRAL